MQWILGSAAAVAAAVASLWRWLKRQRPGAGKSRLEEVVDFVENKKPRKKPHPKRKRL
jgi:hypothetical protein